MLEHVSQSPGLVRGTAAQHRGWPHRRRQNAHEDRPDAVGRGRRARRRDGNRAPQRTHWPFGRIKRGLLDAAAAAVWSHMADTRTEHEDVLRAPLILEYPFRRSVGPVLGTFFTGLREGLLIGVRRADGTVLMPPTEYDPDTAAPLDDYVEVGPAGRVASWAWVSEPRDKHPLDRPFAWALIKLDGADTSMLHVVDAGDARRMRTGMRVKVRWAEERVGHINDIVAFVPEEEA